MGNIFDESDIQVLFRPKQEKEPEVTVELAEESNKKTPHLVTFVKFFSLFIVIFLLSFFLINASALMTKFRYFYDINLKHSSYSVTVATPTPNPFNPAQEARLVIPKIGVDAPIIWDVSENDLNAKLLEGVAHSAGTALPGKPGNIFITGHSSYYSWVNSPYKDVFALLDKLEPQDKIYIKYSSNIFTYEVTGSKVVSPSETSVMDQFPGYNLSLMTCVPVGTNLNRLIISAQQMSAQGS